MDARFYNSEEIDIERLAGDLINIYQAQGYQAQQIGSKDQMMVQLKKGGDFEAIIGMQAALSVTIQRTAGGVLAMIGQQKWLDKAAVGAVGVVAMPVLWPLMLTAGVGAVRQASLSNQVLNVVDGLVRQQRPGLQASQLPMQLLPQVQQMWSPPPPSYTPPYVPGPTIVNALPAPPPAPYAPPAGKLRCPDCNTPYEEGDTFCTGCGKSLKLLCPNCKAELKPGVAFCPKCGASTYQSLTATQAAQPAPAPAPPAPLYTPPPQPAPRLPQPEAPLYTPPAQPQPAARPQPPTYTPPPQPARPSAPKVEPYVPPTPQQPPSQPTPTITYIPAAPKPETPKPQPQRQQAPLYVPPVHPQQVTPKGQPPAPAASASAATPAASSTSSALSASAPWGSLTLSDGEQITLSGERALVGRYDHDLGGIKPEVDLSEMEDATTVSRIHAAIEHSGSSSTVTDLNSTNATRLNGKRLEPDKATPLNDGDTLVFGKVTATFKKA